MPSPSVVPADCCWFQCRVFATRRSDDGLKDRLVKLARQKPRYGYRRLHVMLERGGEHVNHKRVHRIYRGEWLPELCSCLALQILSTAKRMASRSTSLCSTASGSIEEPNGFAAVQAVAIDRISVSKKRGE